MIFTSIVVKTKGNSDIINIKQWQEMILKISARFRGKVEISSKKLFKLWLKLGFHRRFRCKDILIYVRSSQPEVFCEKGFLWSFTKRLCQSLFFNKVAGLRIATLLKKRLWQRCFPVNFVKEHLFLQSTFDGFF